MAAQVRIVSIDYNPPGPDVAGEHVIIQNMSAATVDLTGWTIRDIASYRPHIYEFTGQQLAPGANVRIWTKSGANTATDLFWGRAAAVWNNPGDTAILLDQNKVEVSRFVSVPLPPGASPMRLAVPAFWSLDAQYQPYWSELKQAGSVLSIVVIDGSWPAAAKQNPPPYPTWKQDAEAMLDALPGAVLGYVSTRTSEAGPLRTADDILNNSVTTTGVVSVKDWYDEFGAHIDGIYFDELVLPGDPGSVTQEQDLISQFRGMHPNPAKLMILAGQCLDDWVVGSHIDWAILWESHRDPEYRVQFYPAKLESGDPYHPQYIPPWWKDPANRQKIVHVVHNCDEQYRQNTLALALERNAGNVFVMDRRGLNAKGEDVLYDHLPPAPYWNAEVREVDSYYDFGLDPRRAILAAYRYGVGQGKLYAWPNFEAAWYGTGHVRGTFLLNSPAPGTSNPWAVLRDVAFTDLPATYVPHPGDPPQTPSSFDIPRLWQAVHLYAQAQAGGLFETGIPTFELVQTASGPGVRVLLFASGMSWLHHTTVPVNATYQTPTFAEPGAVVRNVNRVATTNGALASFPTFVPDTVDATGRANNYDCYVIDAGAPVTWSDVPTSTYIQQL